MIKSFGIHIKAKNYANSRAFYEGLGFVSVFEYGPDKKVKEGYSGVVFEVGGAKIEIADGHRAVKLEVFGRPVLDSKISLMIQVDSLADIIARARTMGVEPAVGVRHYYWNTLEVVLKDPDGIVMVFVEPYTEESAKKLGASEEFGKPSSAV